jgi:hypothetical protein
LDLGSIAFSYVNVKTIFFYSLSHFVIIKIRIKITTLGVGYTPVILAILGSWDWLGRSRFQASLDKKFVRPPSQWRKARHGGAHLSPQLWWEA